MLSVLIPDKFQLLENLAIDHVYDKVTTQVILLYRPPSKSDEIYIKLLVDALYCLTKSCLQCCIFGDFNIRKVDWSTLNYPNQQMYQLVSNFIFENCFH